jgi:hypothetical protein
MRATTLLMVTIGLSLAGCGGTKMDESECRLADWRAVGYEDGAAGRPTETFARHRRSCAEHGVAPDFQAWQAGRTAGLAEYCSASRGFQEGSRGGVYQGVCPADAEPGFLAGYRDGRELYDLEWRVRHADERIAADEARMRQIELDLTAKTTASLAPLTTPEQRALLIVEMKQLAEERGTLKREIRDLQADRVAAQKDLDAARAEIVARR